MLITVQKASSLAGSVLSSPSSPPVSRPPPPSSVKSEAPVPHPQEKPGLSDEEIERKCKSIIDEFLHINDYKVKRSGAAGRLAFFNGCVWPANSLAGSEALKTSPGNMK